MKIVCYTDSINYDSFDYLNKEIINCLTMAEEGIHAVLFILSLKSRISQEEESTFKTLQRIFEGKIVDYFIVVFTGGDELEEDNYTLDDYLRDSTCPAFLKVCLISLRSSLFFFSATVSVSTHLVFYFNWISNDFFRESSVSVAVERSCLITGLTIKTKRLSKSSSFFLM